MQVSAELLFWCFVVIISILVAKLEINIEGKHGYAEKLPVEWRTNNKWIITFITGTSYHLYMGLFLIAFLHLPFVVGLPWTLGKEMLVLSFLSFVTVLEDFLFFVLNPHYGIKKYKRECIPWFKDRWLWFCPAWYWWYLPIGVALYIGSFVFS